MFCTSLGPPNNLKGCAKPQQARAIAGTGAGAGTRARAGSRRPPDHLERWRIFLRFFWRRRVRFFFHFQRNIERAFLYGFDLWAIAQARARRCTPLLLKWGGQNAAGGTNRLA